MGKPRLSNTELQEIAQSWLASALDTTQPEKESAEEAISSAYALSGFEKTPRVHWEPDPIRGVLRASAMTSQTHYLKPVELHEWARVRAYGSSTYSAATGAARKVVRQLAEFSFVMHNMLLGVIVQSCREWEERLQDGLISLTPYNTITVHVPGQYSIAVDTPHTWRESQRVGALFTMTSGMRDTWSRLIADSWDTWKAANDIVEVLVGSIRIGRDRDEAFAAVAPFHTLVRSFSYIWAFNDECIVVPKLTTLSYQVDNHRVIPRVILHNGSGPAVTWGDALKVWMLDGVHVPQKLVEEPETLTPEDIINERNAETARVMLQRMTVERFVEQVSPEIADTDTDTSGNTRQLLRIPLSFGQTVTVVRVTCPSTGRQYLLQVPSHVRKCDEAVAWTFGKSASEYKPLVEA